MKITKYIIGLSMMAGTVLGLPSCTDLSETVYDQIGRASCRERV